MARTAKSAPKDTRPRNEQPQPPPPPPPPPQFSPFSSSIPPTVENFQRPGVNFLEEQFSGDAAGDEPAIEYNQDDIEYFNSLPPGFRFCPSDQELILLYLKPKVEKMPLPRNIIMEVNILEHHPSSLSVRYKSYDGKNWYFFIPRHRKRKNGVGINRTARGGYWRPLGEEPVKSGGATVGYSQALMFREGIPKAEWMMHEYRFGSVPGHLLADPSDMRLDEWLLCRICKRNESKKRRRQKDDDTLDNTQQDDESASGMGHSGPSGSHRQQPPRHVQPYYNPPYTSPQLQMTTHPLMLDSASSAHLPPLRNMPQAEALHYNEPRMQYGPEYQSGLISQPWTRTSQDQIPTFEDFCSALSRPGALQDHQGSVDYNHGALMSTTGSQGTLQYLPQGSFPNFSSGATIGYSGNLQNDMRGVPDLVPDFHDYVSESIFRSQGTLQDTMPGLTNYLSNASYPMTGSPGDLVDVNLGSMCPNDGALWSTMGSQGTLQDMVPGQTNYYSNASYPMTGSSGDLADVNLGSMCSNDGALWSTMGSQEILQYSLQGSFLNFSSGETMPMIRYSENLQNDMRGVPDFQDYASQPTIDSQGTLQDTVPGPTNYYSNASDPMTGSSGDLANVNPGSMHPNHGESSSWAGDITIWDYMELDTDDDNAPKPDASGR